MKSLHSFTIDYDAAQIIKNIKKGQKSKYVSDAISNARFLRVKNTNLERDMQQLERANRKMQEIILEQNAKLETWEKQLGKQLQLINMPRTNEPTQKKRKQTITDYLKSIFR